MSFLGTWAVAADHGQGSQELHVVYASPGTITAYRRETDIFPDGTVLVKEVHFAATGQNDNRHYQPCRQAERLVRHGEGTVLAAIPAITCWGDGLGMGVVRRKPTRQPLPVLSPSRMEWKASLDYRENCKSCHLPAASDGLDLR